MPRQNFNLLSMQLNTSGGQNCIPSCGWKSALKPKSTKYAISPKDKHREIIELLVGAEGFEPPTLCSQSRCATRLRYAPTCCFDCIVNRTLGIGIGFGIGLCARLVVGKPDDEPHD